MSKKTAIFLGLVLVLGLAGGYAYYRQVNYIGLQRSLDVGLDEATRAYLQEQLIAAQQSLETAKKNGDEINLNLYMNIAQNAYLMGDLVTARHAIEAQLKGNDLNPVAWNTYAQILDGMGDLKKADSAYSKAVELGQGSEEFTRQYVEFLREHSPEKIDLMKSLLEQAVAAGGQTPWNMQELARIYLKAGNCYEVDAHYKVAIGLAPENENIKKDWEADRVTCYQDK